MAEPRPEIRICHLYPDLMNLYGDRGNVIALERRCAWHGLEPVVVPASVGVDADLESFDIIFVGGGQDREQRLICRDLVEKKAAGLRRAAGDGAALLAICGGYQLLGHYFRTVSGDEIPGIGLLDAWSVGGQRRMIGNVVVECLIGGERRTLVGFENHSGRTFLGQRARPLGRVIAGHGNNGGDRLEGAVQESIIGTYLHGSLLPKNPWLADELISRALARRYPSRRLRRLDDGLERLAHAAAVRRAMGRR